MIVAAERYCRECTSRYMVYLNRKHTPQHYCPGCTVRMRERGSRPVMLGELIARYGVAQEDVATQVAREVNEMVRQSKLNN